jgi:hypothetical protein
VIGSGDIIEETSISTEQNVPQTQMTSIVSTVSLMLPNSSPQLSITEVRIDGTDEYIELTNR